MGMYGVEEGFWVGDDRFEVYAPWTLVTLI